MYNYKWIPQFCGMDTQAVLKYQLAGEINTRRSLKILVGCNTEEGRATQTKTSKARKLR